ncbi:hypothetical protein BD779DRAFT_1681685 [Infundibulicybe gibba]|nr:hypothetical protein BD779DRAFT_1681685 [Infundibulicybe gibba]
MVSFSTNVSDTASSPSPASETTIGLLDGDIRDKPSACTAALTTGYILREIFCRLDTTENSTYTPENKITLLHAASTCRAFMEPAPDVLWRSMSSIMPVMKLLSLNLQTIGGADNIWIFGDDFSDSGWARFDYYSKRVREFRYHSAPAQDMTMAALLYLSRYRPVVFPHLRNIVWTGSMSPFVMLLASSTLGSLDITGVEDDDPGVLTTLLSVLGHLPQSVTKIALRGSFQICLTLVSKISSLSTVILSDHDTPLSLTFLRGLGALKYLECLHITMDIAPLTLLGHIGFPALRTLCISGRFDSIYKFVTILASEQISSISVSSTFQGTHSSFRGRGRGSGRGHPPGHGSRELPDFQDLLKFIAIRWHHLDHLDFNLPTMSPKYPDTTSYTLLQPFHNRHLLDTISIRGFSCLSSSDQDLADMGTSWPVVRTLIIPFSSYPIAISDLGSESPPKAGTRTPTMLGLRQLAELCPGLTTLQLSIDVQDLPTLTGEPLNHSLQSLSVGDSPIKNPVLVAKHLDCIFPYLKTVSGNNPVINFMGGDDSDEVMDPIRDGWKLVEGILHNCQAGRADEYKRKGARGEPQIQYERESH